MNRQFAKTLKQLRKEKGFSQVQLGNKMFVNNSTIARWENGTRLPDAAMMIKLAECLGVDVAILLNAAARSEERPNVIMVDDNSVILKGGLPILEEILPDAAINGFTKPSEAVEYARANSVALAFLDIEMGTASGLDICNSLLEINPHTNVIYLTAYPEYSLEAWGTGACGFMVKPITAEGVKAQLKKLRYPFMIGGEAV